MSDTISGIFKNSLPKTVFIVFALFGGIAITVNSCVFAIKELQKKLILSAIPFFASMFIGIFFLFLAFYIYNFNKNAFFNIENEKLNAQFGFRKKLCTDIKNITAVKISVWYLKLFIGDKIICIYDLGNAYDIYKYITSQINRSSYPPYIADAKDEYIKNKKRFIIHLSLVCLLVVMSFLCILLTDGKSFSEFSSYDSLIFLIYTFAQFGTFFACLFMACKCGRSLQFLNLSKRRFLSALAVEHKHNGLDRHPNPIDQKYFNDYMNRIIVFMPRKSLYIYEVEFFSPESRTWISRRSVTCGSLNELNSSLEQFFKNIPFEQRNF